MTKNLQKDIEGIKWNKMPSLSQQGSNMDPREEYLINEQRYQDQLTQLSEAQRSYQTWETYRGQR